MPKIGLTASSQLKSANATTEIAYHSGKEERVKFKHRNEDIDPKRSHLNVELNVLNREELLEKHYREKIDKHNKNNRGPSRRWDTMDDFLKTFEGKKVKIGGKETDNERWATMSQITYVGNKETMGFRTDEKAIVGEVWDVLMEKVSEEDVRNAYVEGYKLYVEKHNEKFPTLPIYHSDIHFDETTPHGHDAIVVMGHTEAGNPSDSLNNALGEHYGYASDMNGKKRNLEEYRADNDSIATRCIVTKLKELAIANNIDISFTAERTGQTFSLDMQNYKLRMDEFDARQKHLDEYDAFLKEKAETLNEDKRERYEQGFADAIYTLREVAEKSREDGKPNASVYRHMPVDHVRSFADEVRIDGDGNEISVPVRLANVRARKAKEEEEANRRKREDELKAKQQAEALAARSAAQRVQTSPVVPKREVEDDGPEL